MTRCCSRSPEPECSNQTSVPAPDWVFGSRIAATQCLSGTGGLRVAANFMQRFLPKDTVIKIPNPTWANHQTCFADAGLRCTHTFSSRIGCHCLLLSCCGCCLLLSRFVCCCLLLSRFGCRCVLLSSCISLSSPAASSDVPNTTQLLPLELSGLVPSIPPLRVSISSPLLWCQLGDVSILRPRDERARLRRDD